MQKLWNLNDIVINRVEKTSTKDLENELEKNVYSLFYKISSLISNFQFNVVIASFYELYRLINSSMEKNISNKLFKKIMIDFMKLIMPITPHLANECLEKLKATNIDIWPEIETKFKYNQEVKIAVQINGKTREILKINKDAAEEEIKLFVKSNTKLNKFLIGKTVKRTIFVKNKVINYIL